MEEFKFQSIVAEDLLDFYLEYFPELKARGVDSIPGERARPGVGDTGLAGVRPRPCSADVASPGLLLSHAVPPSPPSSVPRPGVAGSDPRPAERPSRTELPGRACEQGQVPVPPVPEGQRP